LCLYFKTPGNWLHIGPWALIENNRTTPSYFVGSQRLRPSGVPGFYEGVSELELKIFVHPVWNRSVYLYCCVIHVFMVMIIMTDMKLNLFQEEN
jgi:hypothetical protein